MHVHRPSGSTNGRPALLNGRQHGCQSTSQPGDIDFSWMARHNLLGMRPIDGFDSIRSHACAEQPSQGAGRRRSVGRTLVVVTTVTAALALETLSVVRPKEESIQHQQKNNGGARFFDFERLRGSPMDSNLNQTNRSWHVLLANTRMQQSGSIDPIKRGGGGGNALLYIYL